MREGSCCVRVCQGRGGGVGAEELRWMAANIHPACYMQVPNITNK